MIVDDSDEEDADDSDEVDDSDEEDADSDEEDSDEEDAEIALVVDKPLCPAGGASCPGEAGRNVSCSACSRSSATLKQATAESAAKLQPMHGISVGGGWFSYIGCMCVCARVRERASERASERA